MVVIRNVFRLKFGKAREAVALFKEGIAIQKRVGAGLDFTTRWWSRERESYATDEEFGDLGGL